MSPLLLLVVAVIYGIAGWEARGGLSLFFWGCAIANMGLAYDAMRN